MTRIKAFLFCYLWAISICSCQSQTRPSQSGGMREAASMFLQSLSEKQKQKTLFAFDDEEKYNWHYVPKSRKGIPLKELNAQQKNKAMNLLRTALSEKGFQKTTAIIELEVLLKELENRPPNDDYRDPGKYYFTLFGKPEMDSIWGWRLEGHHVSFNFSSQNNLLVSGTPGFLGSNPAIVLSGPEKGKQILKEEADLALALLHSFSSEQLGIALISKSAPAEIITGADRKAFISDVKGIAAKDLTQSQKNIFLQLLSLYVHRYNQSLATDMMKEIEQAGLDQLHFAWAGSEQQGPGHPHYYRIHGPTILIEYDNTQNNANHVHTVIRDLKRDFGGDALLEHYKKHPH